MSKLNNEFVFPPDPKKAQHHRRANFIFKGLTEQDVEYCECCQKRIGRLDVDTSCMMDANKLSFLGPGVPLFFYYLRMVILLLALMMVVFMGFALFSNITTNDCSSLSSCNASIFNYISLINKRSSSFYLSIQCYLQLLFIVVVILFLQFLRLKGRELKKECDEVIDSPSDYAVILRRLPPKTNEEQIMAMVEERKKSLTPQQLQQTDSLKVVKVILSFSLRVYNKTKQENTQAFKQAIQKKNQAAFVPKPMPQLSETSSIAIIVFQHQASKHYFIHKSTFVQRLMQFLCTPCIPISELQVNGQKIGIERAPQPDDICWQNSGISMKGAIFRKLAYGSLAILILLIGGGAQYGLELLYNSTSDSTMQLVILIGNSLLILIFNSLIMMTLIITTKKERNQTLTEYQSVLMVKQTIFQFFNAGVFVIGSQIAAKSSSFNLDDGICGQITIIMVTNCFVPNLTLILLNYTEVVNKIFRFLSEKEMMVLTQEELNNIYIGPVIDFPSKYAYILKIVWLAGFYAPLVPVVVIIAVVGLILNYVFQKILFSKVYSVPNTISSMVYENAIELLEYFLITFSMGQLIVYFYFYSYQIDQIPISYLTTTFISISLGIINLALPMDVINQSLFPLEEIAKSEVKYSAIQKNFQVTYEMLNPAYKTQRKRKNVKDILGLGGILEEEKSKKIALEMTNLFMLGQGNQNSSKDPLLGQLIGGEKTSSGIKQQVAGQNLFGQLIMVSEENKKPSKQAQGKNDSIGQKKGEIKQQPRKPTISQQNQTSQPIIEGQDSKRTLNKTRPSIHQQSQQVNIKKALQLQINGEQVNTSVIPQQTKTKAEEKTSEVPFSEVEKKPRKQSDNRPIKSTINYQPLDEIPIKVMKPPAQPIQQSTPQTKINQLTITSAQPFQTTVQFTDPSKEKMSIYNPFFIPKTGSESRISHISKDDLMKVLGRPFTSFLNKMKVEGMTQRQDKNVKQ